MNALAHHEVFREEEHTDHPELQAIHVLQLDLQADAANEGRAVPAAGEPDAALQALIGSPLYQVRRVLRVTQMHWDLPLARGRKAARMARRAARSAPLLMPPRPGAFAGLCALSAP